MTVTRWVAAGLLVMSNVVAAQTTDSGRVPLRPKGRGAPGGGARAGAPPAGRPALENQVRQALAQAVRRQLNLDDEKMRRLRQTDAKFDIERRTLNRDEGETRRELKALMEDTTTADQAKIDQAMTRMLQIQRRRAELLESEYKDLSTFLTPRQRAQYWALRERVTRRMLELQQSERGGGRRGLPPDDGPGGGRRGPPLQ